MSQNSTMPGKRHITFTAICDSTCETETLVQDFQDSPKHSGNASQPLPEQSTMQLARGSMGGVPSVALAVAPRTPERCIVHTKRSHVLLAPTAAGVK